MRPVLSAVLFLLTGAALQLPGASAGPLASDPPPDVAARLALAEGWAGWGLGLARAGAGGVAAEAAGLAGPASGAADSLAACAQACHAPAAPSDAAQRFAGRAVLAAASAGLAAAQALGRDAGSGRLSGGCAPAWWGALEAGAVAVVFYSDEAGFAVAQLPDATVDDVSAWRVPALAGQGAGLLGTLALAAPCAHLADLGR
jgi:hypothetical protein